MSHNFNENYTTTQFCAPIPRNIFYDKTLTLNDIRLYEKLTALQYATGNLFPSNKWLSNELGVSITTIKEGIKKLLDKEYLFYVNKTDKAYKQARYLSTTRPLQEQKETEVNQGLPVNTTRQNSLPLSKQPGKIGCPNQAKFSANIINKYNNNILNNNTKISNNVDSKPYQSANSDNRLRETPPLARVQGFSEDQNDVLNNLLSRGVVFPEARKMVQEFGIDELHAVTVRLIGVYGVDDLGKHILKALRKNRAESTREALA